MFITQFVVICLKNRTFAVSQTTVKRKDRQQCSCDLLEKSYFCSIANNSPKLDGLAHVLWFAWKIVLLQYRKQLYPHNMDGLPSCDLLEKSYFCSIANNLFLCPYPNALVVICLKNRTFAVSQTTDPTNAVSSISLWFAWKIVLLQYRKQQSQFTFNWTPCCDLLEKSYFCSIANNV